MGPQETPTRRPKFSKGKRPQFYPQDGLDELMSMVLVLASEHSAMRDRLDTIEQLAAEKGVILADEIEGYAPDEVTSAKRADRRKSLLEQMYYLPLKRAQEQLTNDDQERYMTALEEIARS